ncbi:hypothetical protein GCM10020221_11650 [Streptomyces thioluteus]|uniref:Uncharacterized protein n=1 Tax=Streptomyces thioluteus TaxID=66431 RepID=A0ABN3WJR5_STRTU
MLHGTSDEANAIARLMRSWLDRAGLSVRGLTDRLEPEHFLDGHVPGRSAVSQRLAGANPQWDFVEAVADVCSHDGPERARMLDDARPLWESLRAASGRRGVPPVPPVPPASTGQEPDGAGQLPMAPTRTELLERELMKARSRVRRSRADRLRRSHERLRRHRPSGVLSGAPPGTPSGVRSTGQSAVPPPDTPPPDDRTVMSDTPPLVTVASLVDARTHGRAAEAARIATTLGLEGTPGYIRRALELLHVEERETDAGLVLAAVAHSRPATLVPGVLAALFRPGEPVDLYATRLRVIIARNAPAERVLEVGRALRDAVQDTDYQQILALAGRVRAVGDVPALVAALQKTGRDRDVDWLLDRAARERPATEAHSLAERLRLGGNAEALGILLRKLDEVCAAPQLPPFAREVPASGEEAQPGRVATPAEPLDDDRPVDRDPARHPRARPRPGRPVRTAVHGADPAAPLLTPE